VLAGLALGQTTTGLPPFSTIQGGLYDDVKINDGSILLTLPMRSKAGLIPFSASLVLNNVVGIEPVFPNLVSIQPQFTLQTSVGFSPSVTGSFTTMRGPVDCPNGGTATIISGYQITDGFGASHAVTGIQIETGDCSSSTLSGSTSDGSGYYVTLPSVSGGSTPTIVDRSGNVFNTANQTFTDPNGNQISYTIACSPCTSTNQTFTYTYTDTTGLTPLTETKTTSKDSGGFFVTTSDVFTWTDAAGNSQSYAITYSPYTLQTSFGCDVPGDIGPRLAYFPSSITAPDGAYSISYESQISGTLTGRISNITFPSGASIAYTYTGGNNGLICQQQTSESTTWYNVMVPILTRTLTDATGTARKWIYDSTQANNETVVTDPSGSDTVYSFYTPTVRFTVSKSFYETQRQMYQGSHTSNNLIKTVLTCYDGNTTNCVTGTINTAIPISQKNIYTTLAGMPTQSAQSQITYDNYGDVTGDTEYDFTGSLIGQRVVTYGTYSGGTCSAIGSNISNRLCTDLTEVGTTVLSQTNNTYNANGNLTSTSRLVSGNPNKYLTASTSYYSNGTINVATDVNGAQTTYNTYACNGNFPATISEPLSLSESMTWDCNGGVVTSVTDENSQSYKYNYLNQNNPKVADPFYRPLWATDPLGNITTYTYSPTTFESAMNFNGSVSTSDSLATTDGFGHTLLAQTKEGQGSSSFDTIQYTYDLDFRPYSTSMPCVATAGKGCSTSTTTTTYDGLSRPLQTTDGGNGYVQNVYNPGGSYQNDVLTTVGPSPAGENTKNKQMEYDSLGRLKSVCELTSTANGGGSCAQTAAQTGYWAQYTYDGLGRLTNVSQNSQSANPQGRAFSYDGLNRLLSESNPETGTTQYTYDSDSTCGSSQGDLVKKVDAVGNVTCYAYDALHREIGISYPSGSYASVTPPKTFVYDSTSFTCANPPNSLYPTGAYVKGRLAEAFTGSSSAKITDVAYCYSPRGEISDVFESTPNSGGYYHTTAYYWANGAINLLGGVPGLNGWTFTPDSEGRPYSAMYGTSTNWVTNATYYPSNASNPPNNTVAFGNGDSDAYGFDPSTGRINSFQFTVGKTPATLKGTPGWNQNGTLGSLGITDPFNSSNTQACSYVYDDLARANSVDCTNGSTTVFQQNFVIDPFGNLSKSGSISFTATYVSSNGTTNNQEQSVASCVPTYDADGNMTKDCSFSSPPKYAWDSDGNPITLRSSQVTFDALDREVEVKNGSTITQILYSPIGKLGTMNGQTVKAARIPLPGGSTAQVGSSGATYILHADWLGSSRLTTNYSTRSMTYDTAYAPFGEAYSSTSSASTYLDFTGQFQDTMVGLDDFLYREYDPVQGRWISPDPAGMGAVNPANPQSWNRYAYVLNNPLSNIDPDGLDCVYLNDAGDDVQSIDHNSNADECTGVNGSNGGYWVPGSVNNSSWVSAIDSDNGTIGAYSVLDNGIIGWTASANNSTGVEWATVGMDIPTTEVDVTDTYDQVALLAIHNSFSSFPNICSLTFSLNGGAPAGRMRGGVEYNTDKGFALRGRAQAGVGPVKGRVTVNSDGKISTSVRAGGTVGVTMGFSGTNITSLGMSANLGKFVSAGVSGQVAPFYSCQSGGGSSSGSE
jgi:RHS repeat-associated protein